jgi:hypothetical protein
MISVNGDAERQQGSTRDERGLLIGREASIYLGPQGVEYAQRQRPVNGAPRLPV